MSGLFWFIPYNVFIWMGLLLPFIFWTVLGLTVEFVDERDREAWLKGGVVAFLLIVLLYLLSNILL